MKPLFRWRTEEDETWEKERSQTTAVPPKKPRRFIIVFIGMLVAGATFIYWQQIRQIQREETQIQEDVLASHHTWEQAVNHGDFDLVVHLISPQDPAWQNTQRQLFLQGLAINRLPLGLMAQAERGETAVTLSPDWQAAEVTFVQTYTAAANSETSALVQLRQTKHYQLDGSRWLQTPPQPDFWGDTLTFKGQWLTLEYPSQDANWAEQLAADLDAELAAICLGAVDDCTSGVNVRLATAPDSLANLHDLLTPAFNGRFHTLPTFTLVGLPLDGDDYQALYQGYTRRIVNAFQNSLNLPLPLPGQALHSLCFPEGGSTPRLFRYDLTEETWDAELSNRAFRFLSPLPDDSGLILTELPVSSEATRLTLRLWQNGQETRLFDDSDRAWRFPSIGWVGQAQPPHLLLNEFDTTTQIRTLFSWLDWTNCDEKDCPIIDLDGFTIWSPDGRFTLIASGSELTLGDGMGLPLQTIGPGFTPFWLDETTYGYIRYTPQMELVLADANDETPLVVLRSDELTAVLNDPETGVPSIAHILPHPTISGLLFLAGPEIRGPSGKYNIFSFQVADNWRQSPTGKLTLRMQLDESPRGYPALLTPGGIPPISIGGNGRYLVAAQLTDIPDDTWRIHLLNISTNQTQTIQANSPDYPAATSFYDWSFNGDWLVVVDDGFFKLIAPATNYERLILHDFDACYFTAWVNQ